MSGAASDMEISDVSDDDLAAICDIYAFEVLHGVSSWEETPPDVAEISRRRDAILAAGYPYRVARKDGVVLGYAYVSAYRPRPAYRYTVENSIYISRHAQRMGVGHLLLSDLIAVCTAKGYRQMMAVIGDSNNARSIDFHHKMGFTPIGTIRSIGYKFGRWLDSVIMQRALGDGERTPPA
ncbi:MAG: N-acetyltransferase family protein [Rhodospirillales bacterium]|nr:N-acetyltransferase family protein [Rhodospirillales bacterium]